MNDESIQVWDIFIRIFHWSLLFFFVLTYLSGGEFDTVHAYAGYIIITLLVLRLIWGVIGTRYARFANFIYSKQHINDYLKSLLSKHPQHYLGHNPAGGAMVILMLIFLSLSSWSGLKAYEAEGKGPLAATEISVVTSAYADDDHNDGNKGDEFWENVHEFFVNITLLLIFVHIAGVFVSSIMHKENLVRAMITGKKKPIK